jgi:hypothetical protein
MMQDLRLSRLPFGNRHIPVKLANSSMLYGNSKWFMNDWMVKGLCEKDFLRKPFTILIGSL